MDDVLVMIGFAVLLLVLAIGGSLFGPGVGIALIIGGVIAVGAALLLARRGKDHSPWHGPSRSVAMLGTGSLIFGLVSCFLGGILGGPALGPRMAGAFWQGTAGKAADVARTQASSVAGSVANLSHRGMERVENGYSNAREGLAGARDRAVDIASAARERLPVLGTKKDTPSEPVTAEPAAPSAPVDAAGPSGTTSTWAQPFAAMYRTAKSVGGRVIGRNAAPSAEIGSGDKPEVQVP